MKIDFAGLRVFVWPNNKFPFKPYDATTIFPIIFFRKDLANWTHVLENHECTHAVQQLEMLLVATALAVALYFFGCGWLSLLALPLYFYCYCIGYLVRRFIHKQGKDKAYHKSPFEAEAYAHQEDDDYLEYRPPFSWVQYLWK